MTNEYKSISQDIYKLAQYHANALSNDLIKNQPHHLTLLEAIVKVAKEDWRVKNEQS